ncbi:MAG: DNA topoisomerase [Clostridia bacterium]|nr:type IA DNA topoisomerase [Clostridium sp.]MBS6251656.1 type IA DNA topoisomerase [Clostridium sp.]
MGKKLLITEKPSVAMEFAKALKITTNRKNGYLESNEWIITWCVGHLVTMSYPDKYDEKLKFWRLDTLPFIPKEWKYEIIPNVQNQFNIIEQLMHREDIEEIYNAGDSGREGEYIQRLVFMMAKPNPKIKIKRVWIDSQTEEEILRGIKEAKDESEYDSLSDSAYLRAKEDYLIGINFSRLLSIIFGRRLAKDINEEKASISVGRVMTCVLGMVVAREREVRNFVKTKYYKIVGEFGEENLSFKADWKVTEKSELWESTKLYNETGFKKENDAKKFIMSLAGKKAKITELKKSKQKENAPLLFNLAEIQNECTKRFKIKPDETLEIIQNLYEKKLVTYPRTDARVLSTAVSKEITKNLNGIAKGFKNEEVQGYIKKMAEEKYSTNLAKTKYVNDSKITDHYAIIPTGQGYENYNNLPQLQKDIYLVILKRFLAIFYPPAQYNKIQMTIEVETDESNKKVETFIASGKVCVDKGYLEILKPNESKKSTNSEKNVENIENNKENELEILSKLKKGQEIEVKNYEIKEAETSPPSRYNSGSIILAMENAGKLIEEEELREQIKGAGIGTSATRGEIIKKLEKIKYIEINTKTQIVTPTKKGELIYDIVNQSMPDMLNPKLTASWEKGLDLVAKKEIEPEEFMVKLERYINSKFNRLIVKM